MGEAIRTTPAQTALDLAKQGFPVFPCGPDKRPLTPHGFKDASADLGRVAEFWRQHPSALIGMPTGEVTGLFVVDLDTDKATGEAIGEASLARLGLSGLLLSVPSVATPSGGRHLYFKHSGLGSTTKRIGPVIDTRGDGGYVIAPGSIAPAGAYVACNAPVARETVPGLPVGLLDALQGRKLQERPAQQFQIDTGAGLGFGPGERAEVQEILSHIPPDCGYGDWVAVLMGLHEHFGGGQGGLALADQWSAGGSKYVAGEVAAKWAGFAPGKGTNWGSVCALARANGADLSSIARRHKVPASAGPKVASVQSTQAEAEADSDLSEYFCAADLDGLPIPPRQWHVPDLVPGGTVTTLNGDGGTGKSLAALQLAVATALGKGWLGQETKPGRALFISAEDDRDEIHRRLDDIAQAEGVRLADMPRLILRSLAGKDALLAVPMPGQNEVMSETPLFKRLDAWLSKHRPALTVLDTLADLFGGNEVNRAQARQFIGMLRGLCLRHETTVILLAHPSLSGMASGSGSSGSTAWNNSVRSRLYLRRVKSDAGDEPDSDARELEVMKANYGKTGLLLPLRWQAGVFLADIRVEGTLDRMAASAKAERVFMKLLREFASEGRRVGASTGHGYGRTEFAKSGRAEGCRRDILQKAMETLFAKGAIRLEDEGPPSRRTKRIVEVQA